MNKTQLREQLSAAEYLYRNHLKLREKQAKQSRELLLSITKELLTMRKAKTKIKKDLLKLDGDFNRYARICSGMTKAAATKRFQDMGFKFIESNLHELEKGCPRKDVSFSDIDQAYFGQLSRIKAMSKDELVKDMICTINDDARFELSDDLQPVNDWSRVNNRFIRSLIGRIDDYFE